MRALTIDKAVDALFQDFFDDHTRRERANGIADRLIVSPYDDIRGTTFLNEVYDGKIPECITRKTRQKLALAPPINGNTPIFHYTPLNLTDHIHPITESLGFHILGTNIYKPALEFVESVGRYLLAGYFMKGIRHPGMS